MKIAIKEAGLIAWGYVAELILTLIIFYIFYLIFPESEINKFLNNIVSDLIGLVGPVLLPAGIAIWLTYANLESSRFGDYLRRIGKNNIFTLTFAYPIFVFLTTVVCLIFLKGSSYSPLYMISAFLTLYSFINVFTLVTNLTVVIRLYGDFKKLDS